MPRKRRTLAAVSLSRKGFDLVGRPTSAYLAS
jgi:hypothetical protein